MTFTDEILSAFIDDELPENEAIAIKDALAGDPVLAKRLEMLRKADVLIAAAYGPIGDEPLPARILEALRKPRAAAGRRAVGFGAGWRPVPAPSMKRWGAPLAAMIALMVGVAAGIGFRGDRDTDYVLAGLLEEKSELAKALDVTFSGDSRMISDNATFAPVLSFTSANGFACREFTISTRSGGQRAVACRRDRLWDIVIAVNDTGLANSGYATASSGPGAQFDAFVEASMDGGVLSSEEEQRLIRSGWTLQD